MTTCVVPNFIFSVRCVNGNTYILMSLRAKGCKNVFCSDKSTFIPAHLNPLEPTWTLLVPRHRLNIRPIGLSKAIQNMCPDAWLELDVFLHCQVCMTLVKNRTKSNFLSFSWVFHSKYRSLCGLFWHNGFLFFVNSCTYDLSGISHLVAVVSLEFEQAQYTADEYLRYS
jgi:hypothetical protein